MATESDCCIIRIPLETISTRSIKQPISRMADEALACAYEGIVVMHTYQGILSFMNTMEETRKGKGRQVELWKDFDCRVDELHILDIIMLSPTSFAILHSVSLCYD